MAMFDGADVCATCEADLDGGRAVQVYASAFYAFCSERCFAAALAKQKKQRWAARRRAAKVLVLAGVVVGALLATPNPRSTQPTASLRPVQTAAASGPPALPEGWFGPDWPPTETSLLAALGHDAWLHPLAGPIRRMPRSDSRVFGAGRPGNRAVECRNGHCGVDLGGEIWGEHIHAVHDGVVDFVQRGANPKHGGRFVRISHRNGTVFTWYFHLAADPARARARRAREGRRRRRSAGRQRRPRVGAAPPLRDLDQADPGRATRNTWIRSRSSRCGRCAYPSTAANPAW